MDHNRVAALHDGRLGPRERDELLNELLANDDEYELFAETAAVLREIEAANAGTPSAAAPAHPPVPVADADDGVIPLATRRPPDPVSSTDAELSTAAADDDGVIPLAPRRAGRRRWMAYGALAAGLAGLALAATLLTNRGSGRLDDPAVAVAMLEGGAASRPAGLEKPWRTLRGGGGSGSRPEDALAVRLGATLVDLELAYAANDPATMQALAGDVRTLLDDVDGSGPVANFYRDIGSRAAAGQDGIEPLLEQGRDEIRAMMPREWLELGVWAEAARIAAARHDADFFGSRRSRAALERINTLPEIEEPLAAVNQVLPPDGRIDWPPGDARWTTLRDRLKELLSTAGR